MAYEIGVDTKGSITDRTNVRFFPRMHFLVTFEGSAHPELLATGFTLVWLLPRVIQLVLVKVGDHGVTLTTQLTFVRFVTGMLLLVK